MLPNLPSGPCVFGAFQPGRLLLRPLSIGHLRAGRPETRVNTGLAGSPSGNAHFTRGSGQVLWRILWRVSLRQLTVIQLAMLLSCAAGSATQGTVAAPTAEVMLRSCASGGVSVVRGRLRNVQDSKPRLLPACPGCDARLSKSIGRKPPSIGHLRAGRPETRVNSGLADRQAGNPRKHWAGGQPLRKRPFYAAAGQALLRVFGHGGCDSVMLHPGAAIRSGYFWDGS